MAAFWIKRERFLATTTDTKDKGGRPRRTLLEIMRTRAWITYLVQNTGASSFRALDNALFVPPGLKVVLKTYKEKNNLPTIRWRRHAGGNSSPDETQLKLVERRELGKGAMAVFEHGPREGNEIIHLWCVFEMNLEAVWKPIEAVYNDLPEWRRRGVPFSKMVEWMAHSLVPANKWKKLNFKDPATHPKVNAVVTACQGKHFTPSLKYLAAAMAMWRIALHRGESMAQMGYLIHGLLAKPCKDLLSEHGIYSQFVMAFNQMEIYDLIQRGELDLAKKQLAKLKDGKAGA
jgi:hypothetical protein